MMKVNNKIFGLMRSLLFILIIICDGMYLLVALIFSDGFSDIIQYLYSAYYMFVRFIYFNFIYLF